MAEANLQLNKTSVYGRYEFAQKSTHELGLPEPEVPSDYGIYNIHALTLRTSRVIAHRLNTDLALGIQSTVYSPDTYLHAIYGKMPVSGQVNLGLTPALMRITSNADNTTHHNHESSLKIFNPI